MTVIDYTINPIFHAGELKFAAPLDSYQAQQVTTLTGFPAFDPALRTDSSEKEKKIKKKSNCAIISGFEWSEEEP